MTEIRLNNKICIFDTSATVSQILAELNLRYSYIVLQQAANKYYVCRPAQLLFWIKFPESFPNTSEDTGNIPLKGLEHLLNELKASGLNSPLGQMFPFNETQRCYPDKHGFASDVGRNKTTQCRTGFAIPFVTFAKLQSGLKRLGRGCKPRPAQVLKATEPNAVRNVCEITKWLETFGSGLQTPDPRKYLRCLFRPTGLVRCDARR